MYHYTVVRSDLPHGVQVAQVVHAAGESAAAAVHYPDGTRCVAAPGTRAVALHAKNEAHLWQIAERLRGVGARVHEVVEDPDVPEYGGQLMAIGIEPTRDRDAIRKAVSSLPLVR